MSNDDRSRVQRMVDSALGTVMGALVIGFFAVLWRANQRLDGALSEIKASTQVFSEQLAQLRVRDDRTVALSEAVSRSEKAIGVLREELARATNTTAEALSVPAINAPPPTGQFPQKAFEVQQSIRDEIQQRAK